MENIIEFAQTEAEDILRGFYEDGKETTSNYYLRHAPLLRPGKQEAKGYEE